VARYCDESIRKFFRADAAFANPQVYEFLEAEGFEVIWTRQRDEARPMSHRCQAANVGGGELYLSLHWTRRSRTGPTGMEIILQEPGGESAGGQPIREDKG